MESPDKGNPSLLDPESSGGDIGESGYAFQSFVLVGYMPRWIADEGFSCLIREAMGDAEAKFFDPERGLVIEFIEAKNHRMTPANFWHEIDRMRQLDIAAPGTYRRFTLACNGVSAEVAPIVNALRRVRDPADFYGNSWAKRGAEGD